MPKACLSYNAGWMVVIPFEPTTNRQTVQNKVLHAISDFKSEMMPDAEVSMTSISNESLALKITSPSMIYISREFYDALKENINASL